MELRNGEFVVYQNKMYEGYPYDELRFTLRSHDPAYVKEGFVEKHPGIFIKYVDTKEIQSYFQIDTVGNYKGYPFLVSQGGQDKNLVTIYNFFFHEVIPYKELGLENVNKGEYQKKGVPISEISDLHEEWRSLMGYPVIDVEDPSTKKISCIIK